MEEAGVAGFDLRPSALRKTGLVHLLATEIHVCSYCDERSVLSPCVVIRTWLLSSARSRDVCE